MINVVVSHGLHAHSQVCAVAFAALPELVHDGENGAIFTSSDELAEQLCRLLHNFDGSSSNKTRVKVGTAEKSDVYGATEPLRHFRAALASGNRVSWEAQWPKVAAPALGLYGQSDDEFAESRAEAATTEDTREASGGRPPTRSTSRQPVQRRRQRRCV